jgi:hypothetical protein
MSFRVPFPLFPIEVRRSVMSLQTTVPTKKLISLIKTHFLTQYWKPVKNRDVNSWTFATTKNQYEANRTLRSEIMIRTMNSFIFVWSVSKCCVLLHKDQRPTFYVGNYEQQVGIPKFVHWRLDWREGGDQSRGQRRKSCLESLTDCTYILKESNLSMEVLHETIFESNHFEESELLHLCTTEFPNNLWR